LRNISILKHFLCFRLKKKIFFADIAKRLMLDSENLLTLKALRPSGMGPLMPPF
jgi:hypothetical protein